MLNIPSVNKNFKRYTSQEKLENVLKIITGAKTIRELSNETGTATDTLTDWRDNFLENAYKVFEKDTTNKENQEKIKVLERKEKENQLLKKLLEHYKKIRKNPSSKSQNSS